MLLLLRHTRAPCRRPPTTTSTRRCMSSNLTYNPNAPAPNLTSLPSTTGVPNLVSRRQWNKLYQPPPKPPKGKDPLDDKPWPRSVQLLGYGVGMTVVPYCIAWYLAANKGIRDVLDPMIPPLTPFLRRWFGTEEPNAIPYSDYREYGKDNLDIPKSLDMEPTSKERKEQACLETLLQEHPVPTRLRVFTEGGFNLGEIIDLPGTTLANTKTLLGILMQDRSRSIGEDAVSHITVEFTDVKENVEEEEPLVELHLPQDNDNNNNDTSTSALKTQIDTMIQTTSIFSSWHYFPQLLIQQQQKNKQQAADKLQPSKQNDIRQSQLEFDIQRLEHEMDQLAKQLKDPTTMRSFDDIQDDLNRHQADLNRYKSELWRLKWKRRLGLLS